MVTIKWGVKIQNILSDHLGGVSNPLSGRVTSNWGVQCPNEETYPIICSNAQVTNSCTLCFSPLKSHRGGDLNDDTYIINEKSTRKSYIQHYVSRLIQPEYTHTRANMTTLRSITNTIEEIDRNLAFELLSHMKGGPSVEVLFCLLYTSDAADE